MSHSFIQQSGLKYIKASINNTLNAINQKVRFLGRCNFPLLIGTLEQIVNVYVIEGLPFDILLGLDLIKSFKVNISHDLTVYQYLDEGTYEELQSGYSTKDPISLEIHSITNIHASSKNSFSQNEEISRLIRNFSDIFSKSKHDIGSVNIEFCKINLSDTTPIALRPYRCSPADQKIIDAQIEELLKRKLIRRSLSAYAFPITLVSKKDEGEKSRLVVDYRKLNKITLADNYPFPRIDDIIDKLYGSAIFSVFDISSGFWHVPMHPRDIQKTAFVTMNDHFEWLVMPFGFRNAPAIFQRIIYTILRKHKLTDFCHNYLDDILIHSSDQKTHSKHLELLFQAIRSEKIKFKLSKCQIARSEVSYLGHMLRPNEVRPLYSNTLAIEKLERPDTLKKLQSFLGKANYYRRFIPNFSQLMAPLHKLLKKNCPFEWTEACQSCFDKVKEMLISQPVLTLFNPIERCYLITDASREGIGAILKQKSQDNLLHPVGYFSRKLLDYQTRYSVTELECLAIVESLNHWHHHLYGRQFTVITDHHALKWLRTIKNPGSRLYNWSLRLDQYDFDVKYIPGSMNIEADYLSRSPIDFNNENKTYLRMINSLTHEEIVSSQISEFPIGTPLPKGYFRKKDIIMRKKRGIEKVYLPFCLRAKLVHDTHMKYGHIGFKKMCRIICSRYIWPDMTSDIRLYALTCEICVQAKTNHRKPLGTLSHLPFASSPFEYISIDTVGGLSGYSSVNVYLHLAIDHLSRYVWALPSKTQTAKDFIKLIKLVEENGKPLKILADQYAGINSRELLAYLKSNDFNITFTTVDCPQSNGLVERVNQTLMNRLRCKHLEKNKTSWAKLVQQVVEEYNSTPHDTTTFPPGFRLLDKRDENTEEIDINTARTIAIRNTKLQFENHKKNYDEKHVQHEFQPGDMVFKENVNKIQRRKLDPALLGPYKIIRKLSNVIYEIEPVNRVGRTELVRISKLTPHHSL